jgi:hypothetical protein
MILRHVTVTVTCYIRSAAWGMGIRFVFNDIAEDHARVKFSYLQFIKRDL